MGILRAELPFEGRFTQTPNEWTRDERLSRRARGLLTEILSHRVGWRLTIEGLVKTGPEGRHAIRAAIDELRDAGYLVVEQGRGERGHFGEVEYRLSDPAIRKSDTGRFTDSGLSDGGSSDSGESPTKEDHPSEHHLEEDESLFPTDGLDEPPAPAATFAEFYMAYPRKVAKEDARKAFEKAAKSTDPSVIVEGARRYAADPSLPEKQYIPYPASWLNAGRWDDEPQDAAPATTEGAAVDEVARARDEWLRRHGITYDDYLEHVDEPGWLENLERSAR